MPSWDVVRRDLGRLVNIAAIHLLKEVPVLVLGDGEH